MTTQVEALRLAAACFREYQRSHEAQAETSHRAACRAAIMGPASERDRLNSETESRISKAARNREMAEMCEAAIACAETPVDLGELPTIRGAPWSHRGNGVIADARGVVLGAFELARDGAAVVAMVNALVDDGK